MGKVKVVARRGLQEYEDDFVQLGILEIDPDAECFVQQSDHDRSDINLIVERFIRTGVLESVQRTQGMYGDFSEITDYHGALRQVEIANESFMTLPATVRARFDNDPGKFLDFVGDEANLGEMAELGLLTEEAYAKYVKNQSQAAVSGAEATPKG